MALCSALALPAGAQIATNLPATAIENFELQTDTVMVKGFGEIGSITTEAGVISVRCKETADVSSARKLYGIAVTFDSNDAHGLLVVDYDELESLTNGLDFLGKVSYNVTPMPGFDASITTRSGLRAGAHTERRQSGIELFLQFAGSPKIPLTAGQFSQFENLINESKMSLDAARSQSSASP
jgi:hypothetical protein